MFAIKRTMIVDLIVCRNNAICSHSFFYFLLSSFSASLSSLDAEMLIRFPCFRYFDACFWQPRFRCFLNDVFYSSSSSSFSSSQFHYHPNIHLNFGFLLHRTIGFPLNPARQLSRKKGCVEPVFGKTADRKTIMDYHPRDQTEKTIINYHVEFEHVQTAR